MKEFNTNGANVLTNEFAIEAFDPCLDKISPDIRCEKNSIGILRIFHINCVEPTTANLPFIRLL